MILLCNSKACNVQVCTKDFNAKIEVTRNKIEREQERGRRIYIYRND